MAKVYPRSRFRRTLKAYGAAKPVTGDADVLIYLDYVLFLRRLMDNAQKSSSGDGIRKRWVEAATQQTLKEFRG